MSKTFLQICKQYALQARFSQLSSAISTVVGQSGRNLEAVEAVKEAYMDIQNRHPNWRWMEERCLINTTASDGEYAFGSFTDEGTGSAIDRFSRWIADEEQPWFIYNTAAGVGTERDLHYMDWHSFRRIYLRGAQVDGAPAHWTMDPQNNVRLGPVPDGDYTVTGIFSRGAQILLLDGDVPDMPENYHDLIAPYALQTYGLTHAAPHILLKAEKYSKRRMRQLEANQLPEIPLAGPMA